MARPVLIIVSGPSGSGKTTLAHELARAIPCIAVCRDEIKEGMVFGVEDFEPGWGDELTQRTFPLFFDVLELLLRNGVTVVADAAFQDKVWRSKLDPLLAIAEPRVVQCRTDEATMIARVTSRSRTAHADAAWLAAPSHAFDRLTLQPVIEVNTTDGYDPSVEAIVEFITRR
jgi:predicted kinase